LQRGIDDVLPLAVRVAAKEEGAGVHVLSLCVVVYSGFSNSSMPCKPMACVPCRKLKLSVPG
jgi:hypothetical protein